MADITLAICAYNASSRVVQVLEAMKSQVVHQDTSWEVVVVDNGSKDNTTDKAREFEGHLPIRVVYEGRQGLSFARERAVLEARGEILSFIDDDNIIDTGWVQACADFFRHHRRAGLVGGKVYPIFVEPASIPADFDSEFAVALACRDLGSVARVLSSADPVPCGAGMTARTDVLRKVFQGGLVLTGRMGGRLMAGEDSEIALKIRASGWEIWYDPNLRMGHLLPPHRLTKSYLRRLRVGFGASSIWLDILEGKQPMPSMAHVRSCCTQYRRRVYKMRLLQLLGGLLGRDRELDSLSLEDALARLDVYMRIEEYLAQQ